HDRIELAVPVHVSDRDGPTLDSQEVVGERPETPVSVAEEDGERASRIGRVRRIGPVGGHGEVEMAVPVEVADLDGASLDVHLAARRGSEETPADASKDGDLAG